MQNLKAVYHIVVSSAETTGAFNTGVETVNLHRLPFHQNGSVEVSGSRLRLHKDVVVVFATTTTAAGAGVLRERSAGGLQQQQRHGERDGGGGGGGGQHRARGPCGTGGVKHAYVVCGRE